MHIDVTSMMRPRSVAIVGASAKRATQGNVVISNLREWGYKGAIMPVHPEATEIDGLAAVNSVASSPVRHRSRRLWRSPPLACKGCWRNWNRARCARAIVFTNGFSVEQEKSIPEVRRSKPNSSFHGPNCMGLVNFTDSIPLYPSRPSKRLRAGKVAMVAQSGSAAISVMNSTVVGLVQSRHNGERVPCRGSRLYPLAADDDATTAIGVGRRIDQGSASHWPMRRKRVHAAGKSLVMLKVGRTATGVAATQAHTGAARERLGCVSRLLFVDEHRDRVRLR